MVLDIQKTRDKIATKYRRELEACDRLRDFAVEMRTPWSGRSLDPGKPYEAILAAICARSLNTYWAAVDLCRGGFGEQAAMLNRSLFEDMLDAHWVSIHPELAVTRYEQHHEHSVMLLRDALVRYPDFYPADELPPRYESNQREVLDAVFGPYGNKPWTTLNLRERVAAVEHLWTDEDGRRNLHFYRDIAHRENNQMLHLSAQGLAQVVRRRDDEHIEFGLGPSSRMLRRVLFGSFWIFSEMVDLELDYFDFERDEDEEADLFSARAFVQATEKELRDIGRNDLCFCGSGKKFKRCHGSS